MKRILLSVVLAGAVSLPAATVASAAQRAGGHGMARGHGQTHVFAPHAGLRSVIPGRVIVRPYGFWPGYYDPYWYPYSPYYAPQAVTGGLRLEIKPKTAEVFVDGYYAGVVD